MFHLMQTLFVFFSSHFLLLSCVEKMLLTDFPISCLIHFFNIFILTYDRFIVKACKVFTWSSSHFLVHLDAYLTHFAENFESTSFVYDSSIVIEGISTLWFFFHKLKKEKKTQIQLLTNPNKISPVNNQLNTSKPFWGDL